MSNKEDFDKAYQEAIDSDFKNQLDDRPSALEVALTALVVIIVLVGIAYIIWL